MSLPGVQDNKFKPIKRRKIIPQPSSSSSTTTTTTSSTTSSNSSHTRVSSAQSDAVSVTGDPLQWNLQQVGIWLQGVGLGRFSEHFSNHGVDGSQLLGLTSRVLIEDLDIKENETIQKILSSITLLRNPLSNTTTASLPQTPISSLQNSLPPPPPVPLDGKKRKVRRTLGGSDPSKRQALSTPQISNQRFTWIATVESWILEHENYCSAYKPGERQQNNGPEVGICCYNLHGQSAFELQLIPESNQCCGVTDSLVLINTRTKATVGSLPCLMTKFLAPLLQNKLIELSGAISCLIHPIGGVPPLELTIKADLKQIELSKYGTMQYAIKKLKSLLTSGMGDWILPRYPPYTQLQSILFSLEP